MQDTATLTEISKAQIADARDVIFMPGYRDASDADTLGIMVAHTLKWDGLQILEMAASALEDANFHSESAKVTEMLEGLK